ncbi:MAG: hypothetical protein LBE13_23135, partial [Bacteroidales bacterium]|nr:hypothetical protein [Bacteroidales bacterium]
MDDSNLLNILHAKLFIFLEDDFQFMNKRNSIVYSFSRMDSCDRKILLNDIKSLDEDVFSSLNKFSEMIPSWFPLINNWNEETAIDDFEGIFRSLSEKEYPCLKNLKDIYEKIDLTSLIDNHGDIFIKYGISISVPSYYNTIFFDNYIRKNSEWKPIRVYTDFGEDTKRHLLETFDTYSIKDTGDTVVCLIDNYLKGGEEAQNIINSLSEFNSESRTNIIGAIFT